MLRDYALSLTLLALVIGGYTALLFNSKKTETPATSVRVEASVQPSAAGAPTAAGTVDVPVQQKSSN